MCVYVGGVDRRPVASASQVTRRPIASPRIRQLADVCQLLRLMAPNDGLPCRGPMGFTTAGHRADDPPHNESTGTYCRRSRSSSARIRCPRPAHSTQIVNLGQLPATGPPRRSQNEQTAMPGIASFGARLDAAAKAIHCSQIATLRPEMSRWRSSWTCPHTVQPGSC